MERCLTHRAHTAACQDYRGITASCRIGADERLMMERCLTNRAHTAACQDTGEKAMLKQCFHNSLQDISSIEQNIMKAIEVMP